MENPEKIEIEGLKTIHKLCKFGADHNMEGCTFTEIVERMFDEIAKAQAIPEGFVLVPKEPTPKMIDATWDYFEDIEGMSHNKRNEFIYKAMIDEAQEQTND